MNYLVNWFNTLPQHIQTPLITASGTILAAFMTVLLGGIIFYVDQLGKQNALDVNLRKNEYLKIIESLYKIIGAIPQIATQGAGKDQTDISKEINDHLAVIILVTLVGSKKTIDKTLKFHKDAYKCSMRITQEFLNIKVNHPDMPKSYAIASAGNVLARSRRDKMYLTLYAESLEEISMFKGLISEIIISMRNDISKQSFKLFRSSRKERKIAILINEIIEYQVTLERNFTTNFAEKTETSNPYFKNNPYAK